MRGEMRIMNEVEQNKELILRYPFLLPRNVWTDKVDDDYDYSRTRLDEVEEGWKELFLQMCEDIREPLIKADYLEKFRFSQIKEKYGTLRAYNFGAPKEVHDIISKYERLSGETCIKCGAAATKISTGWISPYCDNCAEKISKYERFVDIEEEDDE